MVLFTFEYRITFPGMRGILNELGQKYLEQNRIVKYLKFELGNALGNPLHAFQNKEISLTRVFYDWTFLFQFLCWHFYPHSSEIQVIPWNELQYHGVKNFNAFSRLSKQFLPLQQKEMREYENKICNMSRPGSIFPFTKVGNNFYYYTPKHDLEWSGRHHLSNFNSKRAL